MRRVSRYTDGMVGRLLILFFILLASPLAAQTAEGVVDVPMSVPSAQSGVVPTTLLPMGALRIEGGGVRLPGQPLPPSSNTPGESAVPQAQPASAPNAVKPATACVGALDAPLQVQLGAVEGRSAADREADRLMRRHGDLLGQRPTPSDCFTASKNLFRIRLAVQNAADGARLCDALAARGERCMVARRGS